MIQWSGTWEDKEESIIHLEFCLANSCDSFSMLFTKGSIQEGQKLDAAASSCLSFYSVCRHCCSPIHPLTPFHSVCWTKGSQGEKGQGGGACALVIKSVLFCLKEDCGGRKELCSIPGGEFSALLTRRAAQTQRFGVPGQRPMLGDKNIISVLMRGIVANSCARVISERMSDFVEKVSFFIPKPDLAREWGKWC